MAAYPRAELEEMVQRWLAANVKSQTEGNWRYLADYFTEDAYYCWDIPGGLYQAKGRENIRATCMGDAMDPYQGWTYPYLKIVIDEKSVCRIERFFLFQTPYKNKSLNEAPWFSKW